MELFAGCLEDQVLIALPARQLLILSHLLFLLAAHLVDSKLNRWSQVLVETYHSVQGVVATLTAHETLLGQQLQSSDAVGETRQSTLPEILLAHCEHLLGLADCRQQLDQSHCLNQVGLLGSSQFESKHALPVFEFHPA